MSFLKPKLRWLCVALFACFLTGARAEVKVGDVFPALAELRALPGAPALGTHATVVDFCASWCAPCRDSFPVLNALQAELAPRGVAIIGVSVDKRPADFQSLLRKWKPTFPVVHDAEQVVVSRVRVPTMPTSYVLDADGVVRAIHVGFRADTAESLRRDLTPLLTP
ncbi:TlpA family protein disulfide reductase [Nibricoccus sp. IMCC34717]|uniref:TlpA family protein disulfide reductase n=1 Tax=Nibricoccus sp. IMCC34717 TaxID=3034021 RepID=UPI00384AD353